MLSQQIIRTIVYAKILIDSFALNICIVFVPINHRVLKICYRYAITAKGAFAATIRHLELG